VELNLTSQQVGTALKCYWSKK